MVCAWSMPISRSPNPPESPLRSACQTDPYLHDGRATTLRMAIEMHGVAGSEAQPVYQAFAALGKAEQDTIVSYLEAMKLPIQVGTEIPEYAP